MKQFNNKAILTSKNPEVFLNFNYFPEVSTYRIIPDCCIGLGMLYVNGLDINDYTGTPSLGYALLLSSVYTPASFHVYTDKNYNFDANLQFKFYDIDASMTYLFTNDISIHNRPFIAKDINIYDNDEILVDDETSYLLLRTNPKFSGNIKLYVDGSNNLFLDTFKVSDILSNKKYRKQKVSSNSSFSGDIRNTFSSLPLGEMYRVDVDNTLSIGIPKTELKDQYITTYNYGAALLKDELYSEDNGILAPLWINSKIPHYFSVFRLDGVYNQETYDGSALTNLAFKYLQESSLIKSWSLKPDAPLGKYLETHLNDVVKAQAPVFLSLTDPSANEADPNTWYGIAVDKGVVAGRSETTYFFDQKSNNFSDLNAFVSQGFERNNLLCPNIINLEFIFDDNDVSLYTMSRYFGLYLTENVLYNIAYYSNTSTGAIEIVSLDGKDSSSFLHSSLVFDASGNVTSEYANRIFVLNDNVQLNRITNVNQINETVFNSYVSKPNQNIFSTVVEKTNIAPFITLTLNDTLEQGEHLRLINKTQNKIWEIYSVDASEFSCTQYCSISEDASGTHPTVYRTYFDINGDISYQVAQIEAAFDLFGDYEGTQFRSGVRGDNWVSLILNDDATTTDNWVFQRISAPTLNDFSDPSSGFNNAATPEDITFFGRFTPSASDFETIAYDSSYGPIDFELYGNRQSITVNLVNRGTNNFYSFDSSQNIIDKFEDTILYQDLTGWYQRLLDIDVSNNAYLYVKDPLHIEDKILIMTAAEIKTIKSKYNAYSIWPLNISLMGINPVKDMDYTVYDSSTMNFKSEYFYNRQCDVSSYLIAIDACAGYTLDIQGSYTVISGIGAMTQSGTTTGYSPLSLLNTFDSSVYFEAATPTLITYAILDGSYNYSGYVPTLNEENLSDYYDSSVLLKYGLTVPLVPKWIGLGNDCRNNPLRLILNVSTNFIPDGSIYDQEISYPSFKYIGTCGRAWEDYVFYDINDVIQDGSTFLTFKESMFAHPYVDYFSKLVYSNYNVENTKTRSSIVYYNGYKNSVDTIFSGLKLSLKVENIAKNVFNIKNYDRYKFSLISTPCRNKDNNRPIEVIINENTKTILMIWYQGNDDLNYSRRYSSFIEGKSLLDAADKGFVTGSTQYNYSFAKTPFFINTTTISKTIQKWYDIYDTYNKDMARPYAQFNKNFAGLSSVYNAFSTSNDISGESFISYSKEYETFDQYVDYTYAQNAATMGDHVINYGYNYDNNRNWFAYNTTNLKTLKYYLSSAFSYVMYYVIRGEEIFNSYDFGSAINPMTITVNDPRSYRNIRTHNGWYKPKFNSILEFKTNEDIDFINLVEKGFIFSNTNLRLYNNISQLWYNKVVDTVSGADISTGNAISYASGFNVFKSLWDADYYNFRDADNVDTTVDGYQSGVELPAFFGSKLPKLPNDITLEKWDITTLETTESTTEITLYYNLSRSILGMFKNNSVFINNWSNFTNTDNIIDDYIKNTILSYYNISQSKIVVNYYYKAYSSQRAYYEYDTSFVKDEKQNFNGQLVYENDEYIYKIVIPKTANYSYFISFTLTEK